MWTIDKKKKEKEKIMKTSNSHSSQKGSNIWDGMKAETNITRTENEALTFKSTNSDVLDLFSMGGALRKRENMETEKIISKALAEDLMLGIKCLFYLRDIRGGQGERKTFRTGLKILSNYYPKETEKVIRLIPEYGRFDDILYLDNIEIKNFILEEIKKENSLLFKWLPSENSSSKDTKALARALRKYLGFSSKKYRKLLSEKRKNLNLVESKMSSKNWKDIDYERIPSKAMLKYKNAFKKNDEENYEKYIESVEKGEKKINTSTLYPYEIIRDVFNKMYDKHNKILEVMWNNLPNYVREDDKALVVADVSGSMCGLPLNVSISLAMYFAERNVGIFKDKFITFSYEPELQEVKGVDIYQKVHNLNNANWNQNTDIQAVFDLILKTGIKNKVDKKDMPNTIYIISDMEFDSASREETNYEVIKKKYSDAGYEMPVLVFWNVDSRQNNVPVIQNENGVILVSGCSPSIFKMVMERKAPYDFMLSVLNSKRYKPIEDALK